MKIKANIRSNIRVYAMMTVGLFMHALGWTAFMIPAEITGGGIGGVSANVFYATGIPAGYTFLAINVILILIAIKVLGTNFGIKTIYSVIMVSIFLALQQKFITKPIVNDDFMATVLGSILGGAGIGFVFAQGGSTGGTDIIAMIVNKYRNISPGKVILYCDLVIIGSSYFVFHDIEKLVFGFVQMFIVAYTVDLVLNGSKQSVQVMIFSRKHDEIAQSISKRVDRGVTLLNGEGWYSKTPMKIVVTIVRKNEAPMVYSIVKEIDPDAFMSQGQVMGVFGQGFEQIRG